MKEGNLIIDDFNIFYRENLIDDKSEILVFLHGWGASSDLFLKIYPKDKKWLALDFPNFGKSSKAKKVLTMDDYARLSKKFLDKKIKNQKIIFISHSFGGRVLLKMTSIFSDLNYQKVIFVGVPFYRLADKKLKKSVLIIKYFHRIFDLPLLNLIKKPLEKILYKMIYSQDYLALQKDEVMKETFKNVVSDDISKYFDFIQEKEKILIWGENDKTVSLRVAEKFINENKNSKLFTISNTGHFPFLENPDKFLEIFNKEIN